MSVIRRCQWGRIGPTGHRLRIQQHYMCLHKLEASERRDYQKLGLTVYFKVDRVVLHLDIHSLMLLVPALPLSLYPLTLIQLRVRSPI
jgi:hypothetical protein